MEFEGCYPLTLNSKYECLVFDVDDTLYPFSSGLSSQCTKNITEYMVYKLGIEEENASELCVQLYKDYGTTMAGLRALGYDFDYDDYHSYVHGRLPYENLKPDPVLKSLLNSLPIRKVIFSNANEAHVAEIIGRLGLEDCFDDVICFETLNPNQPIPNNENENSSQGSNHKTISCIGSNNATGVYPEHNDVPELLTTPIVCKPYEKAFEQAFEIAKINPHKALFFDDSIRNLQSGKRLGLLTVRVGSSQRTEGANYVLESIHNIKEALPQLWEATGKTGGVSYSGKTAIETLVRA